jgi:hypothetical protein
VTEGDYLPVDIGTPCPRCGLVDDPNLPGVHLCSGMRLMTPEEAKRQEFSPATRARLLAFMDEADRCRARAAVEARNFVVG